MCLASLLTCVSLHAASEVKTMSLDEAILLSVRSQPNIESSRLRYVSQKFNLWVARWNFYPHAEFKASYSSNEDTVAGQINTSQTRNISPSVSWTSPIGTQMSIIGTNTKAKSYNPGLSLEISQPLMRGFGKAVVESALYNAIDSEVIARMSIENTVRKTVTEVINAYLNVVLAEHVILIDQASLQLAETSVKQTKLFIKAGHKAGNELVTVEANVASAKSQLENDQNNLKQSRYSLLTAIGIDPNTTMRFTSIDLDHLIHQYKLSNEENVKTKALQHDLQYKTNYMTLHGQLQRSYTVAKDNTRWKLDLTANLSSGKGIGSGQNAGLNSVFNGYNQTKNVSLNLTIPIDDQLAKQAVLSAKLAIKEAELGLRQEKWSIETNAINAWNNVISAKKALGYADDAQKLQEKTYQISYQKYLHGLIDSLQLQSALQSLTQAKQSSLSARINYIKSLVNMDMVIGHTLQTWQIKVRV